MKALKMKKPEYKRIEAFGFTVVSTIFKKDHVIVIVK